MDNLNYKAFTLKSPVIVHSIITDSGVTNMNHATTFSIRFPSMQTIDYVEEWNKTKDKMNRNVAIAD